MLNFKLLAWFGMIKAGKPISIVENRLLPEIYHTLWEIILCLLWNRLAFDTKCNVRRWIVVDETRSQEIGLSINYLC